MDNLMNDLIETIKNTITLTNDDIKYATFFDEELDDIFRQKMKKEYLIYYIKVAIYSIQKITIHLNKCVLYNINFFNTLCCSYKINSYDFLIIFELLEEVLSIILKKITFSNYEVKNFEKVNFYNIEKQNFQFLNYQNQKYEQYDKSFSEIKKIIILKAERMKILAKTQHEYGINLMCYMLLFLLKKLRDIEMQITLYISITDFRNREEKIFFSNMIIFFDLIFLLKKAKFFDLVIYGGYFLDKNDIFNQDESSDAWKSLKRVLFRVNTNKEEEIRENYEEVKYQMDVFYLLFYKGVSINSPMVINFIRVIALILGMKFYHNDLLTEYNSKSYRLLSRKVLTRDLLSLSKKKLIKKHVGKKFPRIAFRQKIYMKKEYPEISLEYIKLLLIRIYGKDIIEENFGNSKQSERPLLNDLEKKPLWGKKIKKSDKIYYVSTVLLSNYYLNLNKCPYIKNNFCSCNIFNKTPKQNINNSSPPRALIIHIHGGAFLESSVFMHENYLRDLSIKLNTPIIAFNYAGAPKHKYPEGLNDCFQGYMWILNHCENELGFKPEKIIFSGDSSGGNYILGLTFLIIAMNEFDGKNIRLPDLIIAQYPCCHTGKFNINMSLLMSFDDFMLDIESLAYINESYRGYYTNDLDPFLNPVTADEKLLKKMPPVRFLTATHDPLRDDSIKLLYKMSLIPGLDVKGYDFKNFSHGFIGSENKIIKYPSRNIYYMEVKKLLEKSNIDVFVW